MAVEAPALERLLDPESWNYIKTFIATLLQDSQREIDNYERIRFLLHFLY